MIFFERHTNDIVYLRRDFSVNGRNGFVTLVIYIMEAEDKKLCLSQKYLPYILVRPAQQNR